MLGTPAPFISDISSNPSTKSAGLPYETEITNVQVAGNVASVTLVEKGLMGLNFCNYLHLIKDDGKWLIISKVFSGSAQ